MRGLGWGLGFLVRWGAWLGVEGRGDACGVDDESYELMCEMNEMKSDFMSITEIECGNAIF